MTTLSTHKMNADRHHVNRFEATLLSIYSIQQLANSAAARLSVSASRDTVNSAASNAFAHRVVLDVSLWIKETLVD